MPLAIFVILLFGASPALSQGAVAVGRASHVYDILASSYNEATVEEALKAALRAEALGRRSAATPTRMPTAKQRAAISYLDKADGAAEDGQITLTEWLNYCARPVPELNEELLDGSFRTEKINSKAAIVQFGPGAARELLEIQKPRIFDFMRSSHPLLLKKLVTFKAIADKKPREDTANLSNKKIESYYNLDCVGLKKVAALIDQSEPLRGEELPISPQPDEVNVRLYSAPELIRNFYKCQLMVSARGVSAYSCKTELSSNDRVRAFSRFGGLTQALEQCLVAGWDRIDLTESLKIPDLASIMFRESSGTHVISIDMFPKAKVGRPDGDSSMSTSWQVELTVMGK